MQAAYRHWCTWRYDFNAKKSAVLRLGEDRSEHERFAPERYL